MNKEKEAMSQNEVIANLQEGAKSNPVAQSIFLVLSTRQRHRSILNLNPLYRNMKKEGFKYSREDYGKVLLWLEKMNVGRIIRTKRGKIKGLTDIRYKLSTVGSSGLGGNLLDTCKIESFKPRPKYVSLVDRSRPTIEITKPKPLNKVLQIAIRELPITITMPDSMNLKTLIGSLNDLIS